jgi:outer membrane protein assembly factor BamB
MAVAVVGLVLILSGVLVAFPSHRDTQAASSAVGWDWPMYMSDAARSGYNQSEVVINQTSAPTLKKHWTYQGGSTIYSQPVVANGLIYWGSFDGYEHATDLNGQQVWSQSVGGQATQCVPFPLGVVSTAAVVNGVVYVGGSDHNLYALDAITGQILWQTLLGVPNTNTFIWDSPLVVNNNVYIGTASAGEAVGCKNVQGQFFELNALTGAIENTFNPVPSNCIGAGIWGSPTYDVSDGSIYITTGNKSGKCNEPYAVGLVKLNASDLSYESSWQVPPAQRLVSDADFGTTPTLFTATINEIVHQMVGVAHKNGFFYAFDRTALSNGPLWSKQIAVAGNCPECGQGSISPAVFDGTQLYVAGGKTTINGISCGGSVRALNPADGSFLWETCLPKTVLGAVTEVPGVIGVVDAPYLTLINSSTGTVLLSKKNNFYGSLSISNGVMYVGSTTGNLFAFGT